PNLKRVNPFLLECNLFRINVTIMNPVIITVVLEAVIQLELNLENGDFSGGNLSMCNYTTAKSKA
uniref:Neur_chan_LBD domain-containing protein n=1 Tax=Strongyloides stercoralis TaxID=6248 RepID=A0A0K0DZX8_STRER